MDKFYPSESQKRLYNTIEYQEQSFQVATNASGKYFRTNFMMIHFLYLILFVVSALEWCSFMFAGAFNIFASAGVGGQFSSIVNSASVMVVAITFSMSHYYIYLVYGHGYKDAEAQFYVDKYSTLQECKNNLTLMRNFYKFSMFTAALTLAANWLTAKISFADQMLGLKEFLEVSYVNAGMSDIGVPAITKFSGALIAFNWLATLICLAVFFVSFLGVVQTLMAKVK